MAVSTGCIPKEKMVGMAQVCSYISQGRNCLPMYLQSPHCAKAMDMRESVWGITSWIAPCGCSLRHFQEAWWASGVQPGPTHHMLIHLWGCGELQVVPKRDICARERRESRTKEISKLPVSGGAKAINMSLWAGFLSVLGYWSLLFTVVWLCHCCRNNKVTHLVMTQDRLFLLEKGSGDNRQWVGFSPLLATKWSNSGMADCLLQGTWISYQLRNLSTNEGFPAPPVQKGQQVLLSPSDTSFQLPGWAVPYLPPSVLSYSTNPCLPCLCELCTKLRKSLVSSRDAKEKEMQMAGSAEYQDPWALQPVVWKQCVIQSRTIATKPGSAMAKLGFVQQEMELKWDGPRCFSVRHSQLWVNFSGKRGM